MPNIPSSLPKFAVAPPSPGNVPWTPKFPKIAVSPQQGANPGPSTGGLPYEPAPASSHVYGFKMLGAGGSPTGGFVKNFYAPSVGAPTNTRAILMVAFKPNPPKGSTTHPNVISSEYAYFFPTDADAEGWLNQMRGHAHPGEVVQDLIKAGIPYKRTQSVP